MKFFLILFLLNVGNSLIFCQAMQNEKFKAVTYAAGIKLKEEKKGVFFTNISFNNTTVFRLNDSSFIIFPLNPYAMCLVIYEREYLEKMLRDNDFPRTDGLNSFYHDNRAKIDNLDFYAEELMQELKDYLIQNNFFVETKEYDADRIYSFLRKHNSIESYKLNYLAFLSKFITENHDKNLRIGLLKDKQTIDPAISIVLVENNLNGTRYFNIENYVFGNSTYTGVEDLITYLDEFKKRIKGTCELIKIFDWPFKPDQ